MRRSKSTMNYQVTMTGLLTIIGVVGRLLPHVPNVTPLGGMANWSGSRLSWKASAGIIVTTMLVTDIFLGFHRTMPFVYVSFLFAAWISSRVKRVTPVTMAGVVLVNAVLFFLITNLGSWAVSQFYPHTWQGLISAYAAGLPFFRLSLMGDAVYTAAFFGLEYVARHLASRATPRAVITQ